jgi:hypothetical protein
MELPHARQTLTRNLITNFEKGSPLLMPAFGKNVLNEYICQQKEGWYTVGDDRKWDNRPTCSRDGFATFKDLVDHIVNEHMCKSLIVNYSEKWCVDCEIIFPLKKDQNLHLLSQCLKNLHPCRHCPNRYSTARGLENHRLKQHPPSPNDKHKYHKCRDCGKEFRKKVCEIIQYNCSKY